MKKVLIATNALEIGGAETNIIELVIGLKKSGLYEPIVVSNGGRLLKILNEHDIKHYKVHFNTKNPIYYIPTLISLSKIIKKEKIDLIHSHARIPSILCNIIAKRYNKILVTSVHSPFKLNFLYKKISKWGDKTIAVSKDLKEYVLNNYDIKNKDVSVVINGIDTDKFSGEVSYDDIILKYNLKKKANRIVHISRLDKTTSKTVEILIDIFEYLNKNIKDLELIIVGYGTEYKRLYKKADLINKKLDRNAIIFTGNISEGVNKFNSLATLFIGVSRSAFEAMSSKKPVILSGNQGYLGLFDSNKLKKSIDTNFCCRGEKQVNHNILKKDIINFFENINNKEREKIGKYNREVILKYYSKEIMINEIINIYNKLYSEEKSINIVISGSYGRTNSGDEAILYSIIKQLNDINKNINITVLSKDPNQTIKDYNVDSIYTFNVFKIKKALKKCDLFISGGGTLLQNATSTRSILYYLHLIKLAKKCSCKVIMYGCGVGPIKGNLIRKITSNILNKNVDNILLRDSLSYEELKKLSVNLDKVEIGIDPSMLLDRQVKIDKEILIKLNLDENKKYVGICVKKCSNKVILELIKCIEYLYKKGYIPILIPMDYKEDLNVLKGLSQKLDIPNYIVDKYISFSEKYSLISQLDLIIGMRLHSILYAYLSNIKVVCISYDQKIDSFCNDYGISNLIDIKEFTYDKFINELKKLKKIQRKNIDELNKKNIELLKEYIV